MDRNKEKEIFNFVQENGQKGQERKPKLSGAGRKRYKNFLAKGLSREEAFTKALNPLQKENTFNRGLKRSILVADLVRAYDAKRAKIVVLKTTTSGSGASTQTAAEVKIEIIPSDFPLSLLTVEQCKTIEEWIVNKIAHLEEKSGVNPNFIKLTHKSGWISLICSDKKTSEWLMNIASEMCPWENASLRVVQEEELPEAVLMGYFSESSTYDDTKIFRLLEIQNKGLNTHNWRILKRVDFGITGSVKATFSVDGHSLEKLKAVNYVVYYRFGKVQLCQLMKSPTKKAGLNCSLVACEGSQENRSLGF